MDGFPTVTYVSGTSQNRSEEHTSELQSQSNLVCRLLLEKKKKNPPLPPSLTPTPTFPTSSPHPYAHAPCTAHVQYATTSPRPSRVSSRPIPPFPVAP